MFVNAWIDRLFLVVVKNRNPLVRLFIAAYIVLTGIFLFGSWAIATQQSYWGWFYDIGKESGEVALTLFVLTQIPGICRRFKFTHKLVSILMMFRRYTGIATFMFAMIHSFFLRIIPWVAGVFPLFPLETFLIMGVLAFLQLLVLFLTSNDWSITHFGDWWGKIHDLTYIIVWLIFLHVAFQKISIWSMLIGLTAVLQGASHGWVWVHRHKKSITRTA